MKHKREIISVILVSMTLVMSIIVPTIIWYLSPPELNRLQVEQLTCEYLSNPLGIDTKKPRLSWILTAPPTERNKKQTAYHLLVSSSKVKLAANEGDLWDSGEIKSEASVHVEYQGIELISRQVCYWKVKVWDEIDTRSDWSEPAYWIMGILSESDWNVSSTWVGAHAVIPFEERFPVTSGLQPRTESPENPNAMALYLRKEFELKQDLRKIDRGIVRVSGLGYYELSLNGEKVGDHVLDPGATDYSKRVFYVSYDITDRLITGGNCLGVILGNGWYFAGTPDLFGFENASWTAPPKCRLELDIFYNNGEHYLLGTDETWSYSEDGPIRFNCVRGGEIYDARMELGNWNMYEGILFNDERWNPVLTVHAPSGALCAQKSPPMKIMRTIKPLKRIEPVEGIYIYHFPENIAGWIQVSIIGTSGQKITLKMNEKLQSDGLVDMNSHSSHTYGRFQTCEYIAKGSDVIQISEFNIENRVEIWHPRFSYHGFRFVQVEGAKSTDIIDIVAQVVHTDVMRVGEFRSSNSLINRIEEISRRTFLNTIHSYPEDCPHREKAGWLLDGAISAYGSIYNYNCLSFYEKWIGDIIDAQDKSGQVPSIVPTPGWGRPGEAGDTSGYGRMADPWWGGTICTLPWKMYEHYGDARILCESYPAMKKYVDFLNKSSSDYIIRWSTLLGDWLEVEENPQDFDSFCSLIATQAFYYCTSIVAQVAGLLEQQEDEKYYQELTNTIFTKFNEEFLDTSTGLYQGNRQSAQAISLFLGLAPEEYQVEIFKQLLFNVQEKNNGHLTTGIVGTYFLYHALSRYGAPEVAYNTITAENFPGFEYMLNFESNIHGNTTTLWEDWYGNSSLCHPVQGSVVSWFYQNLGGVSPDIAYPGFKRFKIFPQVVGNVTQVEIRLETLYGTIWVNWQMKSNKMFLNVEVPVNSDAEIYIPTIQSSAISENFIPLEQCDLNWNFEIEKGLIKIEVGSGIYHFCIQL